MKHIDYKSYYHCEDCKREFSAVKSTRFVKTSLPKCPECDSNKVKLIKSIAIDNKK